MVYMAYLVQLSEKIGESYMLMKVCMNSLRCRRP